MLRRFLDGRDGNVAILFGLLLVPFILAVGMGVDASRADFSRTTLNEAADAAVLAGARSIMTDPTTTLAEAERTARGYFDAHLGNRQDMRLTAFEFRHNSSDELFSVTASAEMRTTFLAVIGKKTMPIDIFSEASAEPPRPLEVALVLDTTWSMEGAKMTTLKRAAKDMAQSLMNQRDNRVKVGIVPFAQYVNVGVSRRNEPWINVPADYRTSRRDCWMTYPNSREVNCRQVETTCRDTQRTNCRTVRRTCTRTRDGVSESYSCDREECDERTTERPCSQRVCDTDRGAPVEQCEIRYTDYNFHGCVGSRPHPINVEDRDYDLTRVPGLMNVTCGSELTPLTTTKGQVISGIETLTTHGETYIPSGLAWGHRLLSHIAPFSEGEDFPPGMLAAGAKVIVLMTDGKNTKSPTYPEHDGSNSSLADDLTEEACENVKADGIHLFTIAFEVTDATTRQLLSDCASDPGSYFDASNADRLAEAFSTITSYLQEISLTR